MENYLHFSFNRSALKKVNMKIYKKDSADFSAVKTNTQLMGDEFLLFFTQRAVENIDL